MVVFSLFLYQLVVSLPRLLFTLKQINSAFKYSLPHSSVFANIAEIFLIFLRTTFLYEPSPAGEPSNVGKHFCFPFPLMINLTVPLLRDSQATLSHCCSLEVQLARDQLHFLQ